MQLIPGDPGRPGNPGRPVSGIFDLLTTVKLS